MTKGELRKKIKSIKLTDDYKSSASFIIQKKLIDSKEFKEASSIFIYLSTDDEVSTDLAINEAFEQNKTVCVPKCLDDKQMIAVKINSLKDLKKGMYGIMEPVSDDSFENNIDLSVIPCVSAFKDGKRLGHGKGYYDRYLAKHKTYKIALCFFKLISPDIEMSNYDQYMDEVISEDLS